MESTFKEVFNVFYWNWKTRTLKLITFILYEVKRIIIWHFSRISRFLVSLLNWSFTQTLHKLWVFAIYSTLVTSSTSQSQVGGGGRQCPLSAFSRICKFKNKSWLNFEHEGETFPERTIHFLKLSLIISDYLSASVNKTWRKILFVLHLIKRLSVWLYYFYF